MRRALLPCLVAILPALACASARAEDQDLPMPHARPGDVLRIPGLPPVQMPPGVRAYGGRSGPGVDDEEEPPPSFRPRALRPDADESRERRDAGRDRPQERDAARKPPRNPPHSVPTIEAQRAKVLDELFQQLHEAADPDSATPVAAAIERVWLKSGSDTADLLMARAVAAIAAKKLETAEKVLDSIVEIEPGWAEGWNKRATVRFFAGDLDGAMTDIDRALKLEPRHFGALAGLGAILQKAGLDKRALEAYRRALAVYPAQPDMKKAVEKLQIEVEGRDI